MQSWPLYIAAEDALMLGSGFHTASHVIKKSMIKELFLVDADQSSGFWIGIALILI